MDKCKDEFAAFERKDVAHTEQLKLKQSQYSKLKNKLKKVKQTVSENSSRLIENI